MAPKPNSLPRWATDTVYPPAHPFEGDLTKVEPDEDKKDLGEEPLEKPPAEYQNWWKNLVYQWAQYLDGLTFSGSDMVLDREADDVDAILDLRAGDDGASNPQSSIVRLWSDAVLRGAVGYLGLADDAAPRVRLLNSTTGRELGLRDDGTATWDYTTATIGSVGNLTTLLGSLLANESMTVQSVAAGATLNVNAATGQIAQALLQEAGVSVGALRLLGATANNDLELVHLTHGTSLKLGLEGATPFALFAASVEVNGDFLRIRGAAGARFDLFEGGTQRGKLTTSNLKAWLELENSISLSRLRILDDGSFVWTNGAASSSELRLALSTGPSGDIRFYPSVDGTEFTDKEFRFEGGNSRWQFEVNGRPQIAGAITATPLGNDLVTADEAFAVAMIL